MRTLLALATIALTGCAQLQAAPQPKATGVFLLADVTDANASKCGGTFNGVKLADVALQASQPKCKIDVTATVKAGSNTWTACNSAADPAKFSEGCNATPLVFTYTPPATTLNPPTNMRVIEQ